jgi:chromosome segregation ATPase
MMWNNLLDNAKKVADKAKAAAENLEGQLNESVGATPEALASTKKSDTAGGSLFNLGRSIVGAVSQEEASDDKGGGFDDDDDDFFNDDAFYDDDDDYGVDMHDDEEATEKQMKDDQDVPQTTEEEIQTKDSDNNEEESTTVQDSITTESIHATSSNGDEMAIEFESSLEKTELIEKDDAVDDSQNLGDTNVSQSVNGVEFNANNAKEQQEDFIGANDVQNEGSPAINSIGSDEIPTASALSTNGNNGDNGEKSKDFSKGTQDTVSDQMHVIKASSSLDPDDGVEKSNPSFEETFDEVEGNGQHSFDETPENIGQNIASNEDVVSNINLEKTSSNDSDCVKENSSITLHEPNVTDKDNNVIDDELETNADEGSNVISNADEESPSLPRNDSDLSVYVSKEEAKTETTEQILAMEKLKAEIEQLKNTVMQREDQLAAKAEQMFALSETHEREKSFLESKVRETKDEAKKRIGKAKEKVESMQSKLAEAVARADSVGTSSNQQDEIIEALRKEGEHLAFKQSKMEELVRDARLDLRDVKEDLESETKAKDIALTKIAELEEQLAETKSELSSAKEGEGRAVKLDSDLFAEREEKEKNASKVLSLEATLKEMKSKNAELIKEMEQQMNQKLSNIESEKTLIGNEKDTLLKDLELKLRTSEREANMREDSLRHEVAELRKRWQESVRRSDALSMDLQQSSAPLMRQLESTERQNRARAAAWGELESKLRSDLEENVVRNENLRKEKYELESKLKKINRSFQSCETELSNAQSRIADLNDELENTTAEYESVLVDLEKVRSEFSSFQSIAKDNDSKVRTGMISSLQESEERYKDHIESLEVDVRQEREKRVMLEEKIKAINTTTMLPHTMNNMSRKAPKKRSLGGKVNQVDILQSTLVGLSGVGISDSDSDSDDDEENPVDEQQSSNNAGDGATESFAFIEQLSQALKAAKSERESLRKQLTDSEEKRSALENECAQNRDAAYKLPGVEAKVLELTQLITEKDLELQGLREDISDVRQMYRSQLDVLLEEKATGQEAQIETGTTLNQTSAAPIKVVTTRAAVVPSFGMMPSF